jgi:uncharacterized membrane protein YvlD (DUF360 family)
MIKSLLRNYLINLFSLAVAIHYIGSLRFSGDWQSLLLLSAGFTLLHTLIGPLLKTILGPLNFLTLGAVGLIIDSALLYILAIYFPFISVVPWQFPGGEFSGIIIPAVALNLVTGTILAAFVINLIRSLLLSIFT